MSNFGQISAIFNTVNQISYNVAQATIEHKKARGEYKIEREKLRQQERLSQLETGFRDKEIQAQLEISRRRDKLFKDIALYAGIGIGAVALIITVGVLFIGAKREEQFEYIEEIQI